MSLDFCFYIRLAGKGYKQHESMGKACVVLRLKLQVVMMWGIFCLYIFGPLVPTEYLMPQPTQVLLLIVIVSLMTTG